VVANDPAQSYGDAKYIHLKGEKGDDEDVTITFGAGLFSVMPKSGVALASESYKRFVRATYVHAKNPKWDPLLPGPPPALDLSSLFNRARHWLVLQTRSPFIILRLDDSNWKEILETFETRTGLKVDRPAASDR